MSLKQAMSFADGFTVGLSLAREAEARGDRMKVFDWLRATQIIKERKPAIASAGLAEDWNITGGIIFLDSAPADDYTYLASMWATPLLDIDGEEIPCFLYEDETPYDARTTWPDEARAILES